MTITQTDIIGKIRKAIDDIAPDVADSFVSDVNDELWQAVLQATIQLSLELPLNLLDASIVVLAGTVNSARGYAYDWLPDDYLRFVSLDITDTAGIVRELTEPGSDEEKMQRSAWGRGTASKPKAMLDQNSDGDKTIVWWPGDDTHDSAELAYIAKPTLAEEPAEEEEEEPTDDSTSEMAIDCAIREEAEQQVIFRAASIFFEGKKEGAIADRFRNL